MPEFQLDTSGAIERHDGAQIHFHDDLDPFTQGYVEALFFTEEQTFADQGSKPGAIPVETPLGFADLAPETLARIVGDCAKFKADAYGPQEDAFCRDDPEAPAWDDEHAGRDFWYTRNGHGCGFWDGDWPEPYAAALDAAAKAFGNVDAYLGDDGKVYLA